MSKNFTIIPNASIGGGLHNLSINDETNSRCIRVEKILNYRDTMTDWHATIDSSDPNIKKTKIESLKSGTLSTFTRDKNGNYTHEIKDANGNKVCLTIRNTPEGKIPVIEARGKIIKPKTLLDRLLGRPIELIYANRTDYLKEGQVFDQSGAIVKSYKSKITEGGKICDRAAIKEGVRVFNEYVKEFIRKKKCVI